MKKAHQIRTQKGGLNRPATNTEDDSSFKKSFDRKKKQEHPQYITASIVPKNDQCDDEFA